MRYITEIGLTSRFFQAKLAYQLEYHKNSGTLPLMSATHWALIIASSPELWRTRVSSLRWTNSYGLWAAISDGDSIFKRELEVAREV